VGGAIGLRRAFQVAGAVAMGIPVPALSSALAFFDGYRHDRLPARLHSPLCRESECHRGV